jgi:hypothetical protein
MSDVRVLRDHSKPCEHPERVDDEGFSRGAYLMIVDLDAFAFDANEFWLCGHRDGCPGGREVRLRPATVYFAADRDHPAASVLRCVICDRPYVEHAVTESCR